MNGSSRCVYGGVLHRGGSDDVCWLADQTACLCEELASQGSQLPQLAIGSINIPVPQEYWGGVFLRGLLGVVYH